MQLLNDPHSSDSDEEETSSKTSQGQTRSNQKMEAEELD